MATIDPILFYAANVPGKGLGLFCRVDLDVNDIWWTHDMSDSKYVSRVIAWTEYSVLSESEKREIEVKCYVDPDSRSIIVCTKPFWCVNHAPASMANSTSDHQFNSIASKRIPSGEEIVISYEYDAVISIVWKFGAFRDSLNRHQLADPDFLFQPASECPIAVNFLQQSSQHHLVDPDLDLRHEKEGT